MWWRKWIVPGLVLLAFFITFRYLPRVKEEHFNVLVLASALAPFPILLSRTGMVMGMIQAVMLQLVFVLYGTWFWQYRDALSDHYFSFENTLHTEFLMLLFVGALALATLTRLVVDRYKK